MSQPPSPDKALLFAGWERDAETDRYRLLSAGEWLPHAAARAVAFPSAETEIVIPQSRRPVTLAEWEAARASIVSLLTGAQLDLTRAQQQLQRIKEALDEDGP